MVIKYPTGVRPVRVVRQSQKRARNKYHAKKTVIDNIEFDSQAEGAYYLYLKTLGCHFTHHKKYPILDGFELSDKKYRQRIYTPDFSLFDDDGTLKRVVDVKGGNATVTTDSRLRMVMFMERYKVPVVLARYDYKRKTFTEELA